MVGGGPSGVELAGVLPSYLREICKRHGIQHPDIHVDLIEAAPRLLPRMPKAFSWSVMKHLKKLKVRLYLHQQVKAETAEALVVKGRRIISHTVIWTAGVKNHPFFINQNFQLADNGKARVDQFLQSEPGLYVLGDNADTPYSGLAQTALYDGTFVANNLKRLAAGLEPKPYQAVKPIYVIPVGPHWSAVLWGRVQIYGSLGWLLRRAADLVAYHDYEPFQQATHRWIAEKDSEELCPICHSL